MGLGDGCLPEIEGFGEDVEQSIAKRSCVSSDYLGA
jgi:hypothetical protein